MPCQKVNITGGAFQDALGNPLTGGMITANLNTDARPCDNRQICAGAIVSATLDANGNVPSGAMFLYPNAYLRNDGRGNATVYKLKVYTVNGQLAWQDDAASVLGTGGGNFDLNTLVP